MWQQLATITASKIFEIISKYITDKSQAEQITQELTVELLRSQRDIIVKEAESESWLTRSWRPIVMLTFTAIMVADWFGYTAPNIPPEIRTELYTIIKLGLGGYIGGRTVEKAIDRWSKWKYGTKDGILEKIFKSR